MKNKFLLPHPAKNIGLILLIIGTFWQSFNIFKEYFHADSIEAFARILTIIGFLIFAFSKEKCEDEFVNQIRLSSFFATTLFTCIFIVVWMIAGLVFNFDGSGSSYLAISFLQAFYVCNFYYLRFKHRFFEKSL